jgi:aerotolerance regulator-like protein
VSLERPWALALLAVPVLLLWLRLRAARPREAEASSLLVWSKVSLGDTPSAKPRPPLAVWIEALGAAALALGLAGPGAPGTAPAPPLVLLDASPSMRGATVPAEGATVQTSFHPEVDLPSLLAAPGPVVVVTDHRLPSFSDVPGRLWVVGIGKPGFNAGITAASWDLLPDGRWRLFLAVEAHGAAGPVEGTLRIGDLKETITVAPGRPLEVVRDVPPGAAEARIEFQGDALPGDDAVALSARGGAPLRAEMHGPGDDALRSLALAVEACGVRVELGSPLGDRRGIFLVRGRDEVPSAEWWFPVKPGARAVRGAGVAAAGHPLARDVHVDPSSTLGARGDDELPGSPVLLDADGPLVTEKDGFVHFAFLPGGTWVERDPSFVVLVRNLVDAAAGGPARIEATGVLDPRETREAAEGEAFGDLRAALEEARQPDPATRVSFAFGLLLSGAGLLGVAWILSR